MKYKFILSTIALLLLTGCVKSNKTENDLTRDNLRGKVKFISETHYDAVEKFGEITKGDIVKFSFTATAIIMHTAYNEKGNKTEGTEFDTNHKILRNSNYKYDEKGNIIEGNWYNGDGSLSDKFTCKYDKKGNIIEYNWYRGDGSLSNKFTYKYDKKGNMIERNLNFYDTYGELSSSPKDIFKYDEKGNMIERNVYDADKKITNRHIWKYNKKGKKTEMNSYKDGVLIDTRKYDNYENEIYSYDTDYGGAITYKYKYDNQGNWIERIEYSENNNPYEITEREIEYY